MFLVLGRFEFKLLRVQLEVEYPAEGGLLVQTPHGIRTVSDRVPALVVESFRLLQAAEEQRERELSVESLLGLMDEVYHLQVFVQTPGPEIGCVDVSCSDPDFHDVDFRRCIELPRVFRSALRTTSILCL